ncbi:unnamed protein product [marine sediment metagenome]|uniref:Uncharacterized protein n=1 Tax=marine sediment metagenome TaxID=412755 RepID=X1MSB7_9ZZZZ
MTVKEALTRNKDGLPKEAFAIIGDVEDHNTWKDPDWLFAGGRASLSQQVGLFWP